MNGIGVIIVWLTALLAAQPTPPPAAPQQAALIHDGIERTYVVYAPSSMAEPAPLLIVLHGGVGTGAHVMRSTGMNDLADEAGFIVVYPDGLDGWNDGRNLDMRAGADDVGFIAALIDTLAETYPIDEERIFATGGSNGGMMSFTLACHLADRLAGIAAVVANLPAPLEADCQPARPLPVLMMVGTDDPLMPFEGGTVAYNRGEVLSAAQTAAFWRGINGCTDTAARTDLPDLADDGVRVMLDQYEDCTSGAPVWWYTLEGGGHGWPGTRGASDIVAAEVIWAFLSADHFSLNPQP